MHPPLSSSDWAAWAQAFGAVAGIGIAIAVPYYQHRRDHATAAAAKTAREQGTIQNLIAVTAELHSMLLSLQDYVRQKPGGRVGETRYRNLSPLRTVLATFIAHGSSLIKVPIQGPV